MRAIAIDWSGRKSGERSAIRVAEAVGGRLVRVEGGRDRHEAIDHLIAEAQRDPDLVAGLDFSFSLPGWFVESVGANDAPGLWAEAERQGERWLTDCDPPFWGLPGRKRPDGGPDRPQLRRTDVETAAAAGDLTPRSPFQVSGAGSVGSSTVRGLPHLPRLRAAGFRIWPWDDFEPPVAVEIWTRIAIGTTVKSSAGARAEAVAAAGSAIPKRLRAAACESEDSFDAAMTALWLSEKAPKAIGTAASPDRVDLLEGRTWIGPR